MSGGGGMRPSSSDLISTWVRPAEFVLLMGLILLLWPIFGRLGSLQRLRSSGALEALQNVLMTSGGIALLTAFCTTALAYLAAYWLAFYTKRGVVIAALMLLPFAVSYYAHLVAMRSLAQVLVALFSSNMSSAGSHGYGIPLMVGAMVVRYFPLALLFVFLRLRSVSRDTVLAAKNLGIRPLRFHVRVLIPHSRLILLFLAVFLICLTAMDQLAPSIGGGGRLQMLGTLVEDWHRTHSLRDFSISLGGTVSLLVFMLLLFLSIPLAGRRTSPGFRSAPGASPRQSWDGVLGASVAISIVVVFLVAQAIWLTRMAGGADFFREMGRALGDFPLVILRNSAGAALLACLAGGLFGLLSAFATHLTRNPWLQRQLEGALPVAMLLPLLLPPLAVGICLRESFSMLGLGLGSWWMVGLGHLFIYIPVAWFVCSSTNDRLGRDLFEAARNHGVRIRGYLVRVYFPQGFGALVVAVGLLFFLSMNEAVISPLLCGFDRTLGEYIQRSQVVGMGAAEGLLLASLTLGTICALAGGSWLLGQRGGMQRPTRRRGGR